MNQPSGSRRPSVLPARARSALLPIALLVCGIPPACQARTVVPGFFPMPCDVENADGCARGGADTSPSTCSSDGAIDALGCDDSVTNSGDANTSETTDGSVSVDASIEIPFDASECQIGQAVLLVDGDPGDSIHPGSETIRGRWLTLGSTAFSAQIEVSVPADQWGISFAAPDGMNLAPGSWPSVRGDLGTRPYFAIARVSAGSCSFLSSRIRILEYQYSDAGLRRATVVFEQHCNGSPAALRGCFHFE